MASGSGPPSNRGWQIAELNSHAEGNFDRKGMLRAGRRRRERSGTANQGHAFGVEIGFAARPQQGIRRDSSGFIESKCDNRNPLGVSLARGFGIMFDPVQDPADNESVAQRFAAVRGRQRHRDGAKTIRPRIEGQRRACSRRQPYRRAEFVRYLLTRHVFARRLGERSWPVCCGRLRRGGLCRGRGSRLRARVASAGAAGLFSGDVDSVITSKGISRPGSEG